MSGRPYSRPPRAATVAAVTVAVGALLALASRFAVRVVVAGDSMRPALEPGERLVVLRGLRPRVGDVVAAPDPRCPGRIVVKRVAAVGPDGVELAGDHPAASTDSRTFGPVERRRVLGRAVWRYAPAGRTGRLGPAPGRPATLGAVDRDKLQRLLADDDGDVSALSMEELRSRRAECQTVEVSLSYQRRMAQGRLDIVAAERRHRATGEGPDGATLVEQLPGILADRITAPGSGRLPRLMAPEAAEVDTDELDAIVGPILLGTLGELDDAALEVLVERLSAYEAEVSSRRRELHDHIDALQAEITRRYRTGEATVDSLFS
ncbi:MAG TPA: nickel-type superoxide dismutase maturation protease [Acidimicrobiales bacterium]|nr:nickel-type superoxide dismutase maturation protease [Acidimicrobiales bacterium]